MYGKGQEDPAEMRRKIRDMCLVQGKQGQGCRLVKGEPIRIQKGEKGRDTGGARKGMIRADEREAHSCDEAHRYDKLQSLRCGRGVGIKDEVAPCRWSAWFLTSGGRGSMKKGDELVDEEAEGDRRERMERRGVRIYRQTR